MRRSYSWEKRAIVLFAVAVVILSVFLAAFAIREAEREKFVKQAELESESPWIAEQIHERFEFLIAQRELELLSLFENTNEDLDARALEIPIADIQADVGWIDTAFLMRRSGRVDFLLEKPE